jgi:hypothetical protein
VGGDLRGQFFPVQAIPARERGTGCKDVDALIPMAGNAGLCVRVLRRGALTKLQQLIEGTPAAALMIVADTIALSGQFEGDIDTQVGFSDLPQATGG